MTADMPRVKRPRARALAAVVAAAAISLGSLPASDAAVPQPTTRSSVDERGRVTFTISSFNVLGSFHTRPRTRLARMGSGVVRIGRVVRLLDRHAVDVVGFQEFQMDQFEEFYRLAGDRYGVYPGGVNRRAVQNSIAWNLDSWQFVDGRAVPIPYFNGVEWAMPVVLLQNKLTGQLAYFMNFHNPATNRRHRGNAQWRTEAMMREIALANVLYYETDLPVFLTGDMNEREKYFCPVRAQTKLKAANGGNVRDGVCTTPPKPGVDWIFGSKKRGRFTRFLRDDSRLVDRTSDHPMLVADVRLKPAPADGIWPAPPMWPLFTTVPTIPAWPTIPPPPPCPVDPYTGVAPPRDTVTGECPAPTDPGATEPSPSPSPSPSPAA